jgi:hypothetical protein
LIYSEGVHDFGRWTLELEGDSYLTMGASSSIETGYPVLIKYADSLEYDSFIFPKQDTSYSFRHGIQKENGDFLFIGNLYNITLTNMPTTIYICGMTPDFEIQWEKYYPIPEGNYYLVGGDFLVDEDDNIVLSAGLKVFPYSTTYLYLAKFNMEGELLSENFLPDYQVSMYNDIITKPNGDGYILIGDIIQNYAPGDHLELNSDLSISTPWISDPLLGGEYEWLSPPITAKRLSNGNLMFVNRGGIGDQDAELEFMLCNPDYTILRDTLIFDPYVDYTPVRQGMDFVYEDLIWTATFNMYLQPISYDKIFRVYVYDSEMNMIGMKTYGGDGQWWFEHLLATSDGGCIITGGEREVGSNMWDLSIFKIVPDDIFTAAEDTPMENDRDVALYPNPVQDYLHIETARKNLNIRIMDNLGRIVHQQKIRSLPHDKANLNTLTKGVYFYQILDDHRVIQNGKLMKQ